jgi:hypothetical protein
MWNFLLDGKPAKSNGHYVYQGNHNGSKDNELYRKGSPKSQDSWISKTSSTKTTGEKDIALWPSTEIHISPFVLPDLDSAARFLSTYLRPESHASSERERSEEREGKTQ